MSCPSTTKPKRRRQQQQDQQSECSCIRGCGHDGRRHKQLIGSLEKHLFLITLLVVVCYYCCSNITEALLPPFVLTNQLASITTTTTSRTVKGGKKHYDRSSVSSSSSSFLSSTKSPWTAVGDNTLLSKNTNIFNNNNIINNNQRNNDDSLRTTTADTSNEVVPFVIQQVERGMQGDYKEISAMCIDVFFREGTITSPSSKQETSSKNNSNPFGGFVPKFMTPLTGSNTPNGGMRTTNGVTQQQQQSLNNNNNKNPFLGMNLAFLRNAQYGDLTTRKFNHPKENVMFVAREVIPCSSSTNTKNNHRTIIPFPPMKKKQTNSKKNSGGTSNSKLSSYGRRIDLKDDTVYNVRQLMESSSSSEEQEYMTGDVIGFVEVTARPFALGAPYQDFTETGRVKKRPVLANLAVAQRARGSGVGSKLVQSCERTVSEEWNYSEILLQVEDNNGKAQTFYERRRYQVVFSDPASRTYDTSSFGLFPKQVRTTKLCMRKELVSGRRMLTSSDFMKRIRDYTSSDNNKDPMDAAGRVRNGSSSDNSPPAGIGKVVFDLFKKNKD